MNGPDPARETAREDPLGQRVARLLGYYGVDVQGGNLAPDRHVCDELLAIGNEAAELRAQLTTALRAACDEVERLRGRIAGAEAGIIGKVTARMGWIDMTTAEELIAYLEERDAIRRRALAARGE